MSSQKWLPVAITANQTHGAHASHSTFAQRRRTSVAMTTLTISASSACRLGIAAYGFDEKATKRRGVVDRRVRRERVGEAGFGEHPRRRRRQQHVAEEADQVPEDQRVPEGVEALVVLEIDPGERETDDRELREPVRDRGRLDQEAGALDDSLQRQLDHRVEAALELDDPLAVRERGRDALAVGQRRGRPGRRSRSRSRTRTGAGGAPSRVGGGGSTLRRGSSSSRRFYPPSRTALPGRSGIKRPGTYFQRVGILRHGRSAGAGSSRWLNLAHAACRRGTNGENSEADGERQTPHRPVGSRTRRCSTSCATSSTCTGRASAAAYRSAGHAPCTWTARPSARASSRRPRSPGKKVTTLEGLGDEASGRRGVRRRARRAMRLLHQRHGDAVDRLPEEEPASDRSADQEGPQRQHLPLRYALPNPQSSPARRADYGIGRGSEMTSMIEKPHSRRDFLKGSGALIVAFSVPLGAGATRARAATAAIGPALIDATQLDSWLVVGQDGRVRDSHRQGASSAPACERRTSRSPPTSSTFRSPASTCSSRTRGSRPTRARRPAASRSRRTSGPGCVRPAPRRERR